MFIWCLSLTCDQSMVFSGHSSFLHQWYWPPRYNRNIVESAVKHHPPSPLIWTEVPWIRRVWRYQRGNQNPYIEEEQTTQWSKEKVQKDKQWSTKYTQKTKDRVTRTPLKFQKLQDTVWTGQKWRFRKGCRWFQLFSIILFANQNHPWY